MPALFAQRHKITLGKDLVADTTAETTSAVEDMSGYDEITFLVKLGDVDAAAVMTFTVKENTASSVSSPAPTAVAITAASAGTITAGALVVTESSGNIDDKIFAITVRKQSLSKQYVFLSITATVESYEVDAIITLKSVARAVPVTQGSDVYSVATAAA
jgi:hypothetical protein